MGKLPIWWLLTKYRFWRNSLAYKPQAAWKSDKLEKQMPKNYNRNANKLHNMLKRKAISAIITGQNNVSSNGIGQRVCKPESAN